MLLFSANIEDKRDKVNKMIKLINFVILIMGLALGEQDIAPDSDTALKSA
jgi:hypothetical protein